MQGDRGHRWIPREAIVTPRSGGSSWAHLPIKATNEKLPTIQNTIPKTTITFLPRPGRRRFVWAFSVDGLSIY